MTGHSAGNVNCGGASPVNFAVDMGPVSCDECFDRTFLVALYSFCLSFTRFIQLPRPRRLNGLSYSLTSFKVDRYGSIARSMQHLYNSVMYQTKNIVHVSLLLSVVKLCSLPGLSLHELTLNYSRALILSL